MQILPFNLKYYTNIFPWWYLPLMAKMSKTHGIIFNVAFKTAFKNKMNCGVQMIQITVRLVLLACWDKQMSLV